MTKSFFFSIIVLVLFQSCIIKSFVRKNSQVDLLPNYISTDSIRIINPALSIHSVLGGRIEWPLPLSITKQNIFKIQLLHLLDSQKIILRDNFLISGDCLTNKINAENWTDYTWNLANAYKCLKIDPKLYTIFLYNILEIWEIGGSTPANLRSHIHTFVKVFYNNRILYSRSYRYTKPLTNKEQKAFEKTNAYPFFKDDQIKYVVQKVTEDLFKRIQPK